MGFAIGLLNGLFIGIFVMTIGGVLKNGRS